MKIGFIGEIVLHVFIEAVHFVKIWFLFSLKSFLTLYLLMCINFQRFFLTKGIMVCVILSVSIR